MLIQYVENILADVTQLLFNLKQTYSNQYATKISFKDYVYRELYNKILNTVGYVGQAHPKFFSLDS